MAEGSGKLQRRLTYRQYEAWQHLHNPDVTELLYGGAKGGGKTVLGCYWCWQRAKWIAQNYVQEVPRYPIPIGWMGRKVAAHFKTTTLETWKTWIPFSQYILKGDPPEIIMFGGRVKYRTGGLDSSEAMQKFNSAENAVIFADQAEETTLDDVAVLRGSRRLIINGRVVPHKTLFTANPRICWLKTQFVNDATRAPFRRFVPALPGDNEFLPPDYMDVLRQSFEHRPELLQAYLYGDWSVVGDPQQIILDTWLDLATHREQFGIVEKTYLVCDPARYGNDEAIILPMRNAYVMDDPGIVVLPKCTSVQLSGKLAAMSHQLGGCTVVVESTGSDVGAAVIDELSAMGVPVIALCPQGKPMNAAYENVRAEMWFDAAKKLSSGMLDNDRKVMLCTGSWDDKLREELQTPHYKWNHSGTKLIVESKEEIRERLSGGSPNRADAYVIALYVWRWIPDKPDNNVDTTYERPQTGGHHGKPIGTW